MNRNRLTPAIVATKSPVRRAAGVVATVAALVGVALLAIVSGSYFLRIECLVYKAMATYSPVPKDLGARPPWLSPESAFIIEGTRNYQPDSGIVLLYSGRRRCVTSHWRQKLHLPPRVRMAGNPEVEHLFKYSRRVSETDLFCIPYEYRELATRDLVNHRLVMVYSEPDFVKPLVVVWLGATIQSCCIFLLAAGMIRLVRLYRVSSSLVRFHISLPVSYAAAIIGVFPKLTLTAFLSTWCGQPISNITDYSWIASRATDAMMSEVSSVALLSCLLLIATVIAFAGFSGAFRVAAIQNPEAKRWVDRSFRLAIWSVPAALMSWFGFSILFGRAITIDFLVVEVLKQL